MKYFALNKPYGVLSQYTGEEGKRTLAGLYDFPKNVYPVGRLDKDSEGLLLITDDKSLTEYLLNPENRHEREYYTEVEGIPTLEELRTLESGVIIKEKKTLPAKARLLPNMNIIPREPPIRFRKDIPDCWISLTLIEGKNRQVRKMTASIGHPTLRLIRVRIKNILLEDLKPGEVRILKSKEINELKGLQPHSPFTKELF
ncbi:MAG: pseudouridine synthase [Ignavibacteriaceae bacterium]|nr:pseudouridine synthase [Ignavibacteriaceae bacterium]